MQRPCNRKIQVVHLVDGLDKRNNNRKVYTHCRLAQFPLIERGAKDTGVDKIKRSHL